jgi:hypothetical protein
LTEGRLRKAADMRLMILFQHDPDRAFMALAAGLRFHDGASEVCAPWKRAYDNYFPG